MMFLHVCVCVTFIIVFISLSPFFSFLFLFYFLIVYKFSPPLPRFLMFFFSISSSRFTNDFVFISICAPIGGSIIDFCLSLLHQKNLTLSLFLSFFPTNCCYCLRYSEKGRARRAKRRHLTKNCKVCVCFMCVISDHFENSYALAFKAISLSQESKTIKRNKWMVCAHARCTILNARAAAPLFRKIVLIFVFLHNCCCCWRLSFSLC